MVTSCISFAFTIVSCGPARTDLLRFLSQTISSEPLVKKTNNNETKCYYAIGYYIAMSKQVKCLLEKHDHEIIGLARLIHWQCSVKDSIYYVLVNVLSFVLVCASQRQKDRRGRQR